MLFVMMPRQQQQTTAEDFDRFWQAYPRRVAKKEAQKAWQQMRPDPATVEAMLTALAWQVTQAQWQKGAEYIPHPATWLRGERWTDEPPASVTVMVTERERRNAEEVRRKAFGRCPHDPPCGSYAACVTAIALEQRVDPMKARA